MDEKLEFDGKRTFEQGILTVQKGDEKVNFNAKVLTNKELMAFYKLEIPGIIKLLIVYFGLLVISAIFQYGQKFLLQKSANRIIQKMREDVFGQIQRLPIQYFDNLPAGKVVARITNDTEAIRELYVTVLAQFFTSAIYITGIYAALFILDVKLAPFAYYFCQSFMDGSFYTGNLLQNIIVLFGHETVISMRRLMNRLAV